MKAGMTPTNTFVPGKVLRAKHPATKQKAYFATLETGIPAQVRKLETPFKRARDAEDFARTVAEKLNQGIAAGGDAGFDTGDEYIATQPAEMQLAGEAG